MKTVGEAILEIEQRVEKLTAALKVLREMEHTQGPGPVNNGREVLTTDVTDGTDKTKPSGKDKALLAAIATDKKMDGPKRIGRPPKGGETQLDKVTEALTRGPMTVPELVEATGIDAKGVSNCLQRLKGADLAQKIGEGRGCKWDLIEERSGDYEAQKAALGIAVKPKPEED